MVRSALKEDIPWILALEKQCFPMPRERIDLQDFIVDSEHRGYADMKTVVDEGYIGNVAVLPECRRQGIASSLIEALIERAKTEGLAFVTLEVRASNEAAISLYEKHGFFKAGLMKNYYFLPKEDAIIMTAEKFQ